MPIDTPTLGDRSYLVHDGEVAFVVDPQRDIDRVLTSSTEHGVRLTHVLETHIHNDYVTGGLALAERTGAALPRQREDDVSFSRTPVADGDRRGGWTHARHRAGDPRPHVHPPLLPSSSTRLPRARTSTSACSPAGRCSTARPDAPTSSGLSTPTHLVHHQHASAHRLAELLPDEAEVYPTHGFGSFCSATQSDATTSTIGREKQANPVLTQDEQTYVEELLAGLGPWPAYYAHMAPANAAGPAEPDLTPPAVADATELRRRIEAGEWVVDLRHRTAFAAGHAPGTLNFGLDGGFATYVGWLLTWGTPITLLGATAQDVAEAQRELVRIGIDRPAAHATGGPEDWTTGEPASFATATFADLAQVRHHREVVVLDVRRSDEHDAARIDGAVNVPLHELWDRLDEVPDGEVWVHCAGGYRASVAASMLDAAGRTLVAIDDSFDHAEQVGLHLVGPDA